MTTGEKGMMLGYSGTGPQKEQLNGVQSSSKKINALSPDDYEDDIGEEGLVDDEGVFEEKEQDDYEF